MQQSYPFWVKPTSVSFQTFSTWRIKKTSSKNDMVELFLNDIFGKIGQYIILLLQLGTSSGKQKEYIQNLFTLIILLMKY